MPHYVRETHSYDDDGFTTVGRVVDILSHSPTNRRVTVLVEKPGGISFTREPAEVSAEGVNLYQAGSEEPVARVPAHSEPTCSGKGGECSRTVDEPGDYCWQHEPEDGES